MDKPTASASLSFSSSILSTNHQPLVIWAISECFSHFGVRIPLLFTTVLGCPMEIPTWFGTLVLPHPCGHSKVAPQMPLLWKAQLVESTYQHLKNVRPLVDFCWFAIGRSGFLCPSSFFLIWIRCGERKKICVDINGESKNMLVLYFL